MEWQHPYKEDEDRLANFNPNLPTRTGGILGAVEIWATALTDRPKQHLPAME
jgi:hypothetical protein